MTGSLDDLRKQKSAAQARQARAEVVRDQADADLAESRRRLKEEFGVSSQDDARARLAELEEARNAEIEKAEAKLREAES